MLTGATVVASQPAKAWSRVEKGLHALERMLMVTGQGAYYCLEQTKQVLNLRHEPEKIMLVRQAATGSSHWYRMEHFRKEFSECFVVCYAPGLHLAWQEVVGLGQKQDYSWHIRSSGACSSILRLEKGRADEQDHILLQNESGIEVEVAPRPPQARLILYEEVDEACRRYEFVGETRGDPQRLLFVAELTRRRYLLIAEGLDLGHQRFVLSCQSTAPVALRGDGWVEDSAGGYEGRDVSYMKIYSEKERSLKSSNSVTSELGTRELGTRLRRDLSASSHARREALTQHRSRRRFLEDLGS